MAGRSKTRASRRAEDALPGAHGHGPEATDGVVPLSSGAARPPTPGDGPPNADGGPRGAESGRTGAGKTRASAGGLLEDPAKGEGDAPRAGPGNRAKEARHVRQTIPNTISSPDDMPVSSEDIPPISADQDGSLVALPTPVSPEPTHSVENLPTPPMDDVREVPVPAWVGRYPDGTNIPYKYQPAVAKKVAEWVALGANESQIAISLNMRPGKMRELYFRELATGKFDHQMEVGSTILNLAKAGVPQAFTLYAQTQMGWTPPKEKKDEGEGMLNIHIHT